MDTEIGVSVIIPAYNHALFIEACVKSVVDQTHSKLELIIINDGSKDNSHEKILELMAVYKCRFTNVIYINRENKGIGATLNELIQCSKCEFIFQIASDDMAKPEAVGMLLASLVCNPEVALVVGDNEIIDSDGIQVFWDKNRKNVLNEQYAAYKTFGEFLQFKRPDVNFNSDEFGGYGSLLIGNYIPNGKMFRKSALLDVGGHIENVVEDYYINLKLSQKYSFKFINQVLFSYRWHDENTIKNKVVMKNLSNNMKEFLRIERKIARETGVLKEPVWLSKSKNLCQNLLINHF